MDPFAAASALTALLRQTREKNEHARELVTVAQAAVRANRMRVASDLFAEAAALGPLDATVTVERVRAFAALERLEEGRVVLLTALKAAPARPELHAALAEAGGTTPDYLATVWPAALEHAPATVEEALEVLQGDERSAAAHLKGCLHLALGDDLAAALSFRAAGPDSWVGEALALRRSGDTLGADTLEGVSLARTGRRREAEACLRRATSTGMASVVAHHALVRLLAKSGRPAEALRHVRGAMSAYPGDGGLQHLTVAVLLKLNRVADARAFAQSMADVGEDVGYFERVSRMSLPIVYPDEESVARARSDFESGLREIESAMERSDPEIWIGLLSTTNFFLSYQGLDDCELHRRFGKLLRRIAESVVPEQFADTTRQRKSARERLRVGFVSPFWTGHSVSRMASSWVTERDRERIEAYVYYVHTDANESSSPVQLEVLRASTDMFRDLETSSHGVDGFVHAADLRGVANVIRADELDAIVYPSIGMHPMMAALGSLRLAPTQVVAWGHPHTSGLETLDAFLGSDLMEPEAAQAHYSEPLVLLPGIGACVARPPKVPAAPRESLGILGAETLFICAQSLFKIHPAHDWVFAAIAKRVPGGIVAFFEDEVPGITSVTESRLASAFRDAGADPVRQLLFLPRVSSDGFRATLGAADVYLDTLEWSGGITSMEAISAGIPVVTTPGKYARGRQTAAMLWRIGLDSQVSPTPDAYVERAVQLGSNAALRQVASAEILENADKLFDDLGCVRALEDHLLRAAGRKARTPK